MAAVARNCALICGVLELLANCCNRSAPRVGWVGLFCVCVAGPPVVDPFFSGSDLLQAMAKSATARTEYKIFVVVPSTVKAGEEAFVIVANLYKVYTILASIN